MSEEQQINIKIKLTNNNLNFDVKILPSNTVLELKKACSESAKLSEKEQNLVYKGRILSDEKLVSDYNIQNDHTIILVKKMTTDKKETATTSTSQSNPTTSNTSFNTQTNTNQNLNNPLPNLGGMGGFGPGVGGFGPGMGGFGGGFGGMDMSSMMNMMNNPLYQQMMKDMLSNPQTLNMILESPQLKPIIDQNPQLRQMFQNPEMLQMVMNPQNLQQAMQMMGQGGMGGMGSPLSGGLPGMGGLGGMNFGQQYSGSNLGGGATTNTNPNPNVDPKELYKDQLAKLRDMGFINEEVNIDVLKKSGGNIDIAVEKLLNMLG